MGRNFLARSVCVCLSPFFIYSLSSYLITDYWQYTKKIRTFAGTANIIMRQQAMVPECDIVLPILSLSVSLCPFQ